MSKSRTNGHDPQRVFVGTSPGGQDAEACVALLHSLRSRASVPVEVEFLCISNDPASPCYSDPKSGEGWATEQWRTPWTALRWVVPEICGWRGRAVYFDCPTVVLGDVSELALAPLRPDAFVLLRRGDASLGTACAVFDCARAREHLPPARTMQSDVGAHQTVGVLLDQNPTLAGALPGLWGATDIEFAAKVRGPGGSVHFPSPLTQPHVRHARARLDRLGRRHWHDGVRLPHFSDALVQVFEAEYAAALAAGYSVEQYGQGESLSDNTSIAARERARAGQGP